MKNSEESLRLALLTERLANVALSQGARQGAEHDVSRRLIEDHKAEILTGGVIRLGSGSSIHAAIEALRENLPEYFGKPPVTEPVAAPSPAPAPTPAARRKRASDRLARANGDTPPRLDPAPRRKLGDAA